nr:ADP-ribosylglycohydrolase family protein [Fodinicola feengrottensis]
MNRMLRLVRAGQDWRTLAAELFEGQGSWGNGAAMRVAPLGAWFADDLSKVAEQAALSAAVTHTHPDGIAAAIAVAVATAVAPESLPPRDFLDTVLQWTPPGRVHQGMRAARGLAHVSSAKIAVHELGNGRLTAGWDTVPFALWAAARNLDDFEEALGSPHKPAVTSTPPAPSSEASSPYDRASPPPGPRNAKNSRAGRGRRTEVCAAE